MADDKNDKKIKDLEKAVTILQSYVTKTDKQAQTAYHLARAHENKINQLRSTITRLETALARIQNGGRN